MAWDREIDSGDGLIHRFDSLDSIYVLSTASPYFVERLEFEESDGTVRNFYQFNLPAISEQISKGDWLNCSAIMSKGRQILAQWT